ncbi:MAG TPA: PHP domain-containing protein [Vicinamibacterales bacterium]|nr:PHP domain-containing protein [Vicinamibacterales bacterium]
MPVPPANAPFLLRRLRDLRSIDAAQERMLARDGIATLPDLDLAVAEERPAAADRALRRAAERIRHEIRPILLGRAWDILDRFMSGLSQCAAVDVWEAAGAVRRSEPIVQHLVVAARTANPDHATECVAALLPASEILLRNARRLIVQYEGVEIDVRVAPPDEYGSVLLAATGPPAHVAALLRRRTPRLTATEAEAYAHAGLAYLPPETRDSADALDRAGANAVPRLVSREDIRGDLHMHTSYSDGRDPLRHMVLAARALGYQYIAITDHSEHAGASRTLTLEDLARQADEIAQLQQDVPDMTILHGIEVDIMPDGSLDCPDAVLASLDIVLASLHDSAGQDGTRLTRRCLAAIEHPFVSVITHPANQLVGRRAGYDMDYDAIYAAAAATGTALEIDGAPAHLDLSGERAREAVAAGATVVIDSDCHRAPALERQMRMGVGTARRGWVEPGHVLNTRSLADVRAFLAGKRTR